MTIFTRNRERKDIFDDDEEYEEYEGFLPLRARRKARCLTTETVRTRSNFRNLIINLKYHLGFICSGTHNHQASLLVTRYDIDLQPLSDPSRKFN